MHIKKLKINNFKGISTLEFEPKKINLLVGRNNTGKTSVLEAIYLLFTSDEIGHMYRKYVSDIIRSGAKCSELSANLFPETLISLEISKPEEINEKREIIDKFRKDLAEILFELIQKKNVKLSVKKEEIEYEVQNKIDELITPELIENIVRKSVRIIKNKKDKSVYYQIVFEEALEIQKIMLNLIKYLEDKYHFELGNEDEIRGEIMKRVAEKYYPFLYLKEYKNKGAVLIKDILDNLAKERLIIKEQGKDKEKQERILKIESIIKNYNLIENLERLDFDYVVFKDKNQLIIPFDFLGGGFKAMIGLLWYISSEGIKNKICLLDEPEMHMHPGYIQELIKILIKFSKDLNIQFFITTHNSDFIDLLIDAGKEENYSFSSEEKEYLMKELLVIRMDKIGEETFAEGLNYEDAKYTIDELLLDLRGI